MRLSAMLLPLVIFLTACETGNSAASPASSRGNETAAVSEPAPSVAPATAGIGDAAEKVAADTGGSTRYSQDERGDANPGLPQAIVRALATDELVLSCRDGTRAGVSQFAADWVGVRRLDLNQDGRKDWIVNGRHACLRTSYAAYWWAYADTPDGPRGVLRAEPAATLEVLLSSTQGFRDMRMHIANGRGAELVADSRYDGKVYVSAP